MDLVEHNMRTWLGVPDLCIDQCISSMGLEMKLRYGTKTLRIERQYAYGTEV